MSINIRSLTAFRGICCSLVMIAHANMHGLYADLQGGGPMGVMLFFSLSGFLMAYLYPGDTKLASWRNYFFLRIARIFPAYLFVIIACWVMNEWFHFEFAFPITTQNIFNHFILLDAVKVFWTVPVEMKFYALYPFIAAIFTMPFKSPNTPIIILLLIWGSLGWTGNKGEKMDLLPYIIFFLAGVMGGYIYNTHYEWLKKHYKFLNLMFIISCICVIICLPKLFLYLFGFSYGSWQFGHWPHTLLFSALSGTMVLSAACIGGRLEHYFSNIFMLYIGKISFSLYLIHQMVYNAIHNLFLDHMEIYETIGLPINFILSISIASIIFFLVEQPSMHWMKRKIFNTPLK